jgi:tagaturonate epimerase
VLQLPKYTMGVGDRFGRQGAAQLAAFVKAREAGIDVAPVWNKSHREHAITGTKPQSVRDEADAAVRELGWNGPYFVDADHIRYDTVDEYIASSDFFTIDVADKIGSPYDVSEVTHDFDPLLREIPLPGGTTIEITAADILKVCSNYVLAIHEARRIYDRIKIKKGSDDFVVEISMDETDAPQSAKELLLILSLIAQERIAIQTIAPKFAGRFNKGVDYDGDTQVFAAEFDRMVGVVRFAVEEFGLPQNLKLSVHTGSDKFSIYPVMRDILAKHNAGIHLKTAGTTWLEELAALAEAGWNGLTIANLIYRRAYDHREELCGPYAAVIAIDVNQLPAPDDVEQLSGPAFAAMVRHDPGSEAYNPHARQLLHLAFKIAAEMGDAFYRVLDAHDEAIAPHVTANLYRRHILPLFGGRSA